MGEIRPKRCEGRELTKDQLEGTICALSRALGDAFEPFANQYVPILWTKTIITIQVTTTAPPQPTPHPMNACYPSRFVPHSSDGLLVWFVCPQVIAESSHICIVEVLQHTQAPKLLRQSLEVGVGDRDPR